MSDSAINQMRKIGSATLILGNCYDVLDTELPDGHGYDSIVTDSPYGISNNTDYRRFSGGEKGHATALRQDAATPHKSIPIEADCIYELRVSREYDPFSEQARQVAD